MVTREDYRNSQERYLIGDFAIKAWYQGVNGVGSCPVLIVGVERNHAVVWKLINKIVLERVVPLDKLYITPFWEEVEKIDD